MKLLIVISALYLLSPSLSAQTTPIAPTPAAATPPVSSPTNSGLTVTDVLALHNAKVADSVIIAKLAQANQPIDLSTDDILKLKNAGVSAAVLRAMIEPSAPAGQTPATNVIVDNKSIDNLHSLNATGATPVGNSAPAGNPDDPMAPHDSGVYLATNTAAGQTHLVFMDRADITGTAENVGAVFSFFAVPLTVRYIVQPPKAAIRTQNPSPVFYFYFEDKAAGLGKSAYSAANVSSPTQFELVKFSANKKQRTMPALKFGIFEGAGTAQKAIPFTSDRLRDGLYRVTPTTPLKPGEYTFVAPPPQTGNQAPVTDPNAPKPDLFDFGVDAP